MFCGWGISFLDMLGHINSIDAHGKMRLDKRKSQNGNRRF